MRPDRFANRPVHDTLAFLLRRWRFITVGAVLTAAVMAVLSWSLPDVYSAWVVIDTGTLGRQLPRAVDGYRDRFNGEDHRRVVEVFPTGTISKVWLHAAPPLIMIRADAVDGESAAAAAREAARIAMSGLAETQLSMPVDPPPSARDDTVFAVRKVVVPALAHLGTALDRAREEAHGVRRKLTGALTELERLAKDGATAAGDRRWRSHAVDLKALADTGSALDERVQLLDELGDQLRRATFGPIPQRAVEPLSRAAAIDLTSSASMKAAIRELRELLADAAGPPVEPLRVTVAPVAPAEPTWPNHAVNVLIAFLFGLIAATFVAVLLEPDVTPQVVERT